MKDLFTKEEWQLLQAVVNLTDAGNHGMENTLCQLRHPETDDGAAPPPLVNYVTVPMHIAGTQIHELQIGACEECLEYLMSGEWLLYYCISCTESRWRERDKAKLDYVDKKIVLMDSCLVCDPERKPGVRLI